MLSGQTSCLQPRIEFTFNMLNLKRKEQFDFGSISACDDDDIKVHKFKRASQKGLWTESLRLLRDIVLIVAVFVLFGVFVAQPVVVEGTSMVPQLQNGERLIVNKLVYYNFKNVSWGHLERGDIVVFWYPQDPSKSFVKRIIALPGESVEIKDHVVFINDHPLKEPYLNDSVRKRMADLERLTVEKHHFYVMGDNRENSSDSRSWGQVPEKYIYGKVFFRYWRPSKFGFLQKGETKLEDIEEDPDEDEEEPEEDYQALGRH